MTAIAVVDLGFGDAGKGTVVDWLSRRHPEAVNIRFNGGPQAAHNVVTPEGTHHTFSQFGSGMLVPGTVTYLSRHMLVDPLNMVTEHGHLEGLGINDAWQRTWIDPQCLIVTPYHRALNRLREIARGENRHGSCGLGIGECVSDAILWDADALRARDLSDAQTMKRKLEGLRQRLVHQLMLFQDEPVGPVADRERAVLTDDLTQRRDALLHAYARFNDTVMIDTPDFDGRTIIFEGAQGVLLDEKHGFHPHTTWSNCTPDNAQAVLNDLHRDDILETWGVTRTYMTRHGAGPFPTENEHLTRKLPEQHNDSGGYQGAWRCGTLDTVALRYAVKACLGIDGLVVTHMDRVGRGWNVCCSYQYEGEATQVLDPERVTKYDEWGLTYMSRDRLPGAVAQMLDTEPVLLSSGPTADDKLVP